MSQTVPAGSNVTVVVVAEGGPPPVYQWFFDSAGIPGAVESSLTITNFQSANEGGYSVLVTNEFQSVMSEKAMLYLDSPFRFANWFVDSNGWFQARLVGRAGTNFAIDGSASLPHWISLTTNAAPFGILDFKDTNRLSFTNRFYRAWLTP